MACFFRRTASQAGMYLAFGMAIALTFDRPAQAVFLFDTTGSGSASQALTASGFAMGVGDALGQGEVSALREGVGSTFQLYVQSEGAGLWLAPGGGLFPALTHIGGQITLDGSFTIVVTSVDPVHHIDGLDVAPTQSSGSFLRMYYNSSATANLLAGTGFTDGTVIWSGRPFARINGDVDDAPGQTALFDHSGTDAYGGMQTVLGSSVVAAAFLTDSASSDFFITSPPELYFSLIMDPQFTFEHPSRLFAGPGPGGTDISPNLGTVNGLSGPDFQFETVRPNLTTNEAPEPSTLTLFAVAGILLPASTMIRIRPLTPNARRAADTSCFE